MQDNAPLFILRSKNLTGPAKGQPAIHVTTTSQFKWLYNDSGSGARRDISIWRPTPAEGVFILGDNAVSNWAEPTNASMVITVVNDDPNNPLVKPPVGFVEIWNDRKSGGNFDCSLWRPKAPDGYLSLGDVCSNAYKAPDVPTYRCIRKDLVTDSETEGMIWDDRGSGSKGDCMVWKLSGVYGAFVAQGNYNPYIGDCFKLAGK